MKMKKNSSVNNADLFENTLSVIEDLSTILKEEIILVKKQDVPAIQELMRRKVKLIISYQSILKNIAQTDIMKQTTTEMRVRLKAAGEKLAKISEQNTMMLKAASEATQMLINSVIKTIREEALPSKGYSDPRNCNSNLGSYSPLCPPVAVNRTA